MPCVVVGRGVEAVPLGRVEFGTVRSLRCVLAAFCALLQIPFDASAVNEGSKAYCLRASHGQCVCICVCKREEREREKEGEGGRRRRRKWHTKTQ